MWCSVMVHATLYALACLYNRRKQIMKMEKDSEKSTMQMALNKLAFVALAFMHLGVTGR